MIAQLTKAPTIVAKSRSSGRQLILGAHTYTYSDDVCVAYSGPGMRFRRGATNETVRAILKEFGAMAYPLLSSEAFEASLPTIRVGVAP